jgi:hypothetical protein
MPPGWTAGAAKSGIVEIRIAGSEDVVIAGFVTATDAAKVAATVAAQTTSAFKIETPFPLKRGDAGMVQSGGILLFSDGRRGIKYVAAAPVRTGGTALVAIVTPNRQDKAYLDKIAELGDMMRQMQAGRMLVQARQATPQVAAAASAPKQRMAVPVIPPPPLPGKVAPGMAGLVGMWKAGWMETRYGMAGMEMVAESVNLIFARDGSFSTLVPDGSIEDSTIRAVARSHPDQAGTATVAGNKMLLRFANGKTGTVTIERSGGRPDGLSWNGRMLSPKYIGRRGLTLSGTYTRTSLSQTGFTGAANTSFVGSTTDIRFSPDGRFSFDKTLVADTPAVVSRDTDASRSGRYIVFDGTLVMRFGDGTEKISSLWYENSNLEAIWLDDSMYSK